MDLNPQQIKSIVYALRFKIEHLKSVETDVTVDEDDIIDATNDRGYLQGLLGVMELELRRKLGMKSNDPI
jgi:hypothetical protein